MCAHVTGVVEKRHTRIHAECDDSMKNHNRDAALEHAGIRPASRPGPSINLQGRSSLHEWGASDSRTAVVATAAKLCNAFRFSFARVQARVEKANAASRLSTSSRCARAARHARSCSHELPVFLDRRWQAAGSSGTDTWLTSVPNEAAAMLAMRASLAASSPKHICSWELILALRGLLLTAGASVPSAGAGAGAAAGCSTTGAAVSTGGWTGGDGAAGTLSSQAAVGNGVDAWEDGTTVGDTCLDGRWQAVADAQAMPPRELEPQNPMSAKPHTPPTHNTTCTFAISHSGHHHAH